MKELLIERVRRLNPNIEVLKYINRESTAIIKCKFCNETYPVYGRRISSGNFICKCQKFRYPTRYPTAKTLEKYKEEVFNLVGDEYSIPDSENYINNKTKMKMIHNKCRKCLFSFSTSIS